MLDSSTIGMIVSIGVPLILAPLVIIGLRYSFTLFLTEGDELFSHVVVSTYEAKSLGSTLAITNGLIFLVTWYVYFTCGYLDMSNDVLMMVSLGGLGVALLATVTIVHYLMGLRGWMLGGVGMLSFVGGNLPLILIVPLLMLLVS